MTALLLWLLAVEGLGLVAFPLAFRLLRPLSGGAWAFSKPLGLLALTLPLWWAGSLRLLPAERGTALAVLVLLGGLSCAMAWWDRSALRAFLRAEGSALLALEGLFFLSFGLWTLYRLHDPAIAHTEQPMDLAFLSASVRARFFPPEDPWLRGFPITYYYLGYLVMGTLTELTGQVPWVAYNLALSLVGALAGVGTAGLAYGLARLWGAGRGRALGLGLLALVAMTGLGNLEGVLEGLRALGLGSPAFWEWVGVPNLGPPSGPRSPLPSDPWWWWRATRVLDNGSAITEFPFFSLLLGDLHPHLVALAFWPLGMGLATAHLVGDRPEPLRVGALGLWVGAMGFLDTPSLPSALAMGLGAVAVRAWPAMRTPRGLLEAGLQAGLVLALAGVPYLPFLLRLEGQAKGIAPVLGTATRPLHFFLLWGVFLTGLAPFLLARAGEWAREGPRRRWLLTLGLPLAPALAHLALGSLLGEPGASIGRVVRVLPALVGAGVCLDTALARQGRPALQSVCLLMGLGLLLWAGPELFYLVDLFGTRMNTVFKLFYQAWAFLAPALPLALYAWAEEGRRLFGPIRLLDRGWRALVLVLLVGSLYYPLASSLTQAGLRTGPLTLDGLAHLERSAPGERQAIEWLWRNARPGEGLLEAVGDDYTDFGRLASATGVPTVLGWPGHELQWRGSSEPFAGRAEAVARFYRAEDPATAWGLAERFGVDYVAFGPRERARYGVRSLAPLEPVLEPVVRGEDFVLYRLRERER